MMIFALRKLRLSLLLILFELFSNHAHCQNLTVSGTIADKSSGESLISANIYEENGTKWTASNNYGHFSMKLPPGEKKISFSYVGYEPITIDFDLRKDTVLSVFLTPNAFIEEVVITADRPSQRVLNSQMNVIELQMARVKSLPFLLGEPDIIKALQLTPGVMFGMEGSSGLYVRGGGPDQNLILLDGVPVYNANHLFGFYSVFNSDAIQSTTLIKGGLPARYGGKLSSVLDIRMKEGNMKEFRGTASIGTISSALTLEGPLVKDKTSFIVSARRTYLDALSYPVQMIMNNHDSKNIIGYFFYDLNAKINHKFSERSRLFISAYTGMDKYFKNSRSEYEYSDTSQYLLNKSKSKDELKWGNITAALRWNYLINSTTFNNLTLIYSRYNYKTNVEYLDHTERIINGRSEIYYKDVRNSYSSGIKDYGLKWDLENTSIPGHYLRVGINNTIHLFTPGVKVFLDEGVISSGIDTTFGNRRIFTNEFHVYAEDDFDAGRRFKLNLGIHYSDYLVDGKLYQSLEPRFSGRFLINENISLKASYARLKQYNHLLTNSIIGLPTDMWVPSTKIVKPQKAWQLSTGVECNFGDKYEITSEVYYKNMTGLISYSDGASYFNSSSSWEEKVVTGSGKAYGFEIMLQKIKGKLTGWIGYTLSKSTRKFDGISFGREFPYTYDRRHDLSVVLNYRLNEKIDINGTWVLASGNHITLPDQKYLSFQGLDVMWLLRTGYFTREEMTNDIGIVNHYDIRNNYTMPTYHRLDIGVNFKKAKKWGERIFSFGAYNAYNRLNAFYVYYTYIDTPAQEQVLYKVTLFPFIPYLRYSISF